MSQTIKDIATKLTDKLAQAERIVCLEQLQDLEKQRWVVHNKLRELLNHPRNWLESDAFVSVLPRRHGKTTLLNSIKTDLLAAGENVIVATSLPEQTFGYQPDKSKTVRLPFTTTLMGLSTTDAHLLIEEFTLLGAEELQELLSREWKSVSMFGTFIWKKEKDYTQCFVLPAKHPLSSVPGYSKAGIGGKRY